MNYLQHYELSGRTALVSGAGQGIGSECAAALAQAGAHVYCTDRDEARAYETAQALVTAGFQAESRVLDVTDTVALDALSSELAPLDILICNAGTVSNTPAEEMCDEEWDRVIATNLTGVFKTCRAFGRRMLSVERGAIVNIGSMSGSIVNTPQPQCHYNASKAGVHHLTRSLAVEWAKRGIRVNAVAPTYIATPLLDKLKEHPELIKCWLDLTPMGRMGKPSEIASVVLFLASDAASLMTGSVVTADAGYTAI